MEGMKESRSRLRWSIGIAFTLAYLVTFLPGLRTIQVAKAAGAVPTFTQAGPNEQVPPVIQIIKCDGPMRVLQGCQFNYGSPDEAWYRLEQQAISDMLKLYNLPDTDRTRLLDWERDALRAIVFDKLMAIIKKAPTERTADERLIYDQMQAFVRAKRLQAATVAQNEYNKWANNPCGYAPPAPFTFPLSTSCGSQTMMALSPPKPPTFEEFQNYGTYDVYRTLTDAEAQAALAGTVKVAYFLAGVAIAGIAATVAGFVGASLLAGSVVISAIFPFLAGVLGGAGSGALFTAGLAMPAGVMGAAALAGPVAIIIITIVIAVMEGIAVFQAAEIPGKLQAAVDAADDADLAQLATTEAGYREIFSTFMMASLPLPTTTNGTAPPAQQSTDRKWEIVPEGGSVQTSATITYQDWLFQPRSAYLTGSWMVETAGATKRLTLDIDYVDWDGKGWTAWRMGDKFLHTRPNDAAATPFVSDTIKYKDPSGANRTAKLGPADVTLPTPPADTIKPTANPVTSPAPNAAGWNNTPVTVTWNWADNPGGSGLDTANCPATSVINTAGAQMFGVTCKDLAGNAAQAQVFTLIDWYAPQFFPAQAEPAPNLAGWNNTDVTVTFTCHDGSHLPPGETDYTKLVPWTAVSGVVFCVEPKTLPTDGTFPLVTSKVTETREGKGLVVTGKAEDLAGNTSTQEVRVNIDKTAPDVQIGTVTCSVPGNDGWCRGTQSVTFNVSDNVSGLAGGGGIELLPQYLGPPLRHTATVTNSSEGPAVTLVSGAYRDHAGNRNPGKEAGPFKIDSKKPVLAACPTGNAARILLKAGGGSQAVTLAATDEQPGSGINTTASKLSGTVSTATVGSKSVTFTAVDNAGNEATATCAYEVVYDFSGFFEPVNNPPMVNTIAAGQALRVIFGLAGDHGLAIFAAGSPTSRQVACASGAPVDEVEQTETAGGSGLTFNSGSSQYTYLWKTDRAWSGTCRELVLTLNDGTTHTALFQFR